MHPLAFTLLLSKAVSMYSFFSSWIIHTHCIRLWLDVSPSCVCLDFLSSANISKSPSQLPPLILPSSGLFFMCLTVLSFTAACRVKSLPRCGRSLWRREGKKKRGRRNEQRSYLSFQVVAPLGIVMADGSSKCLPSFINVHCRRTCTTSHCSAEVQLHVKDHDSI